MHAARLQLSLRHLGERTEFVELDVVSGIVADFGTSLVSTVIRFAEVTVDRCAAVVAQQRRVRWVVQRPSCSWAAVVTVRRARRLLRA